MQKTSVLSDGSPWKKKTETEFPVSGAVQPELPLVSHSKAQNLRNKRVIIQKNGKNQKILKNLLVTSKSGGEGGMISLKTNLQNFVKGQFWGVEFEN